MMNNENILDILDERYKILPNGEIYGGIKKSKLKSTVDNYGYVRISLQTKSGKWKMFSVHRLVATKYIPNPQNKPIVNHIDGNKLNNNVNNLEWCTDSENKIHAYKHNLIKKKYNKDNIMYNKHGKNHPKSKPVAQYSLDGTFIKKYESITEASEETGIHKKYIGMVCNKNKHIYGKAKLFKWAFINKGTEEN